MSATDELFKAIRAKDLATFRPLLDGVDPDSQEDGDGDYAITLAAGRKQAEMVRLLLAAGATVDARREGGRTALHYAAWHFELEVVEALIAAGADVNAVDKSNWTPIFLTSRWEQFETLLKHGARVDVVATDGETLIRRMSLATGSSAPQDGVKILTKLVELGLHVEDESLDGHGHSLLMNVIDRGRRPGAATDERNEVAHYLIEAGMDPLLSSPVGITALHYACKSADLDMVTTLVALGADPNAQVSEEWYNFDEGSRPLDMIEKYKSSYKAIKKALAAGGQKRAKPAIKNAIEDNHVVVSVNANDFGASLDVLLKITADIKANVYKHPDYDHGDEHLQFRFDVDGEVDALEEQQFFAACAQEAPLLAKLEKFVRQIIAFNETRGGEPVYTHEEQEAGGLAVEALLGTKDPAYLPLFLDYLKSIDLDHTVHLYDLMDTVRASYSPEQLEGVAAWLGDQGFEG